MQLSNILQKFDPVIIQLVKLFENKFEDILGTLKTKTLIEDKGGGDYTYSFDVEIEKLIFEHVRETVREIPLKGEERQYGNGDSPFLMVDPIDGSTNAKRDFPFFGTLIAYMRGKEINNTEGAVVWDIPHRKIYFAQRDLGAYKYSLIDKKLSKLEIKRLELKTKYEKLYDVTPHSPLEAILKLGKYGKMRHIGTLGLAICNVAEQSLDLAIDISGRARMVDVVAPLLILREAGGHFIIEPEAPVEPNTRVFYIASWSEELLHSVKGEIWEYRGKKENNT